MARSLATKLAFTTLGLLGPAAICRAGPQPAPRPNIVLIIWDDWDSTKFGFLGDPQQVTPVTDALFAGGVVFPDAHAPASVCRPSLASLLSGRTPQHHGIKGTYTQGVLDAPDAFPVLLRDAGYATFIAGKFWESSRGGQAALAAAIDRLGFDDSEGLSRPTDLVRTDQADTLAWLATVQEPFFLFWSPRLPHRDFDAPAEFYVGIDPQQIELPTTTSEDQLEAALVDEIGYYANAARLDAGVGELVAALPTNTIVIVLADNGMSMGRVSKLSPFEAGLRTAISFTGPGIPASVRDDFITGLDIPATILGLAGLPTPSSYDGRDLSTALLTGAAIAPEPIGGGIWTARPLGLGEQHTLLGIYFRDARYKYIYFQRSVTYEMRELGTVTWLYDFTPWVNHTAGEELLFDLDADPWEEHNLAFEQPALVAEFGRAARRWWFGHTRTLCPADVNLDSVVNILDVSRALDSYGADADGDTDQDGDTDLSDLAAILSALGAQCPWD